MSTFSKICLNSRGQMQLFCSFPDKKISCILNTNNTQLNFRQNKPTHSFGCLKADGLYFGESVEAYRLHARRLPICLRSPEHLDCLTMPARRLCIAVLTMLIVTNVFCSFVTLDSHSMCFCLCLLLASNTLWLFQVRGLHSWIPIY